jgi:hypothetical protein
MLFILIGVLLLLVNMEVLNHNFWIDFVFLFPFLLIAIGIEKIFAKTRFKAFAYLSTVLLAGGALYVAFEGSRFSDHSSFFESGSISWDADDEPVDVIDAVLKLGDASLTIRKATRDLFYARFDEWSHKPRSSKRIVDGRAEISLTARSSSRSFRRGLVQIDTDEPEDWRVSFSENTPLILKCVGEDGDVHLNLETTPLRELNLDLNDATIYLKLGYLEPRTQVNIAGYDSKLRLRVPREAGLRVTGVDDPDYLEEIGLVSVEGAFVSEGIDDQATQINIELDDRFRSLSIDFY